MDTPRVFLLSRLATQIFFVSIVSGLCAGHVYATDLSPTETAPPGWSFTAKSSDSLFRAHRDQIGTLHESRQPSHFLTAPVILRRASALSTRSASAKMVRLEKELAAYLDRQKSKPTYRSAKIIDDTPTIELEFGKSGKGLSWVFATVKADSVMIIAVDSREAKPVSTARQEFFNMAKNFQVPSP